jgi:hypothetical protein
VTTPLSAGADRIRTTERKKLRALFFEPKAKTFAASPGPDTPA